MTTNKRKLLDEKIKLAFGSKDAIDKTLKLLKYLGLAEEAKSALGWKATNELVNVLDRSRFTPLGKYGTGDSTVDRAIMKLLCDAAWPGMSRHQKEWVSGFAFTVLENCALIKKDRVDDEWRPSEWLCDLIAG